MSETSESLLIIHFIRHAESEYNKASREWTEQPRALQPSAASGPATHEHRVDRSSRLWDAPITERGKQQVLELRARLSDALAPLPEVVVVSPLTRAIQTGLGIFHSEFERAMWFHRHLESHSDSDPAASGAREAKGDTSEVQVENASAAITNSADLTTITTKTVTTTTTTSSSPQSPLAEGLGPHVHTDTVTEENVFRVPRARGLSASSVPAFEVSAFIREHLAATCDIGNEPEELRRRFPMIRGAFAHLPRVWWGRENLAIGASAKESLDHFVRHGGTEGSAALRVRVDEFIRQLRARPERCIAVVAHGDLLHSLIKLLTGQDRYLENCEVFTARVERLKP